MRDGLSPEAVARELDEWFQNVSRLSEESLFAFVDEGPHRDAVILDVLTRNARSVVQATIDRAGTLYTPLCLFLVAARRRLAATVGVGHWKAAVRNVLLLREQMATNARQASAVYGLAIGSAASRFKEELDQAVLKTGLLARTDLDKVNREIALGLGVNWGMRFLLAYALECELPSEPARKDLGWITGLMTALGSSSASARS